MISQPIGAMITAPYLLSVSVPIKVAPDGTRWADDLWAKDLALHIEYIQSLTLICPSINARPLPGDVRLDVEPFSRIKIVELSQPKSIIGALKALPLTIKRMWSAVRDNEIVHTGFGWWPIGEGLIAAPICRLQGKFLITYVESSFWRAKSNAHARLYDKARGFVLEHLYRACVRSANLRFFTSEGYLADFLSPDRRSSAYVRPATWIDDDIIIDDQAAVADWDKKSGAIELLFAGRLTRDKGIDLLLEAAQRSTVKISIIGEGPLKADCLAAAARMPGRVTVLEPVPYGHQFFSLLRNFDAVIVPSISDEQPRIIFDAFSQAIPVIGSRTGGITQIVTDTTGKLVEIGNATALADALSWTSSNRTLLREMGLAALKKSRSFTHRAMHLDRRNIILNEVQGGASQRAP